MEQIFIENSFLGSFFAKNLIDLQNCSNSLFVHIGQGIDDNLLYLMRIRLINFLSSAEAYLADRQTEILGSGAPKKDMSTKISNSSFYNHFNFSICTVVA